MTACCFYAHQASLKGDLLEGKLFAFSVELFSERKKKDFDRIVSPENVIN